MIKPLFSVIVVSLNASKKIKVTLDSVLSQSFERFEIIVKDGGSSDDTLSFIPEDKRIRLIKQPDNSVYEGMNQAIEYVEGKFIIFMNCGDCFADSSVLTHVAQVISNKEYSDECILYGDYLKYGIKGSQTKQITREYLLKKGGICHQSMVFGNVVFDKCGKYDLSFPICADYEFMTRAFVKNVPFYHIDLPVCIYEGGGLSERPESIQRVRAEGDQIRKKYFSRFEIVSYYIDRIRGKLKRIHV